MKSKFFKVKSFVISKNGRFIEFFKTFFFSFSTSVEEDLEICQICQKVNFCKVHAPIHQPKGLEKCLSFKVDTLNEVGRILRASKTIQKGDFAILDKAFTIGKSLLLIILIIT